MSKNILVAVRENDQESIQSILSQTPNALHEKDPRGSTPLLLAAYLNHLEAAEVLLSHAPNINEQDVMGNTPLMGVCFKGHVEMAKLLIQHGAEVNKTNQNVKKIPLIFSF